MGQKKPARNISGLNREVAKSLPTGEAGLNVNQGTFGSKLVEPVPNFIETDSEKCWSNDNNASIVLGRDRPSHIMTGYGGRGDTQAGSIHLVTGRGAHDPISDAYVDPDFDTDAACMYISQKTDIDANFGIAGGNVGSFEMFEKPGSGVAIKADGVRICARDAGIKLVTSVGESGMNSQGGWIKSVHGIDLIAGNDDRDMQPIVKGDNLELALEAIASEIATLTGIVSGLTSAVQTIALSLATHTHLGTTTTFPPIPVFIGPSIEAAATNTSVSIALASMTQPSLIFVELNKSGFKFNYLNPMGDYYINSEHNYTN